MQTLPPDAIPFEDKAKATEILEALQRFDTPAFIDRVRAELAESAAPDKALIRLHRFLDLALSPKTEVDLMAASPRYLHLLLTLFSQSNFLTDILFRYPEYASWLWHENDLSQERSSREMLREILGRGELPDFSACCSIMRRFRQREMLRIAVRDIVEYAPVASITQEVSNLADATLEAAIQCAQAELDARYGAPQYTDAEGNPRRTGFVIFGMGKLGGCELNFSSDIDLLFFYTEEGETTGEGPEGPVKVVENAHYFQKLGEMVIKALSENTPEGIIFRVDMRLRPHGSIGPLSVSLENALNYYTTYGRAWERQALIKARPCAGDIALGETFLERLRPFVFPKYFDDATLEDIRSTKQQTEAQIARRGETEREVKLGRGGIRDIEFTVQMLQLLNGGRYPEFRTRNTLEAIAVLGRLNRLKPFEANALSRNYQFLRQVEHRLQIEDGRQCHTLPADRAHLDEFARRLGYRTGEAFMHVYRDRTQEIRDILEHFLAAKGSGHLWIEALLSRHSQEENTLEKLAELGFTEPAKAREELRTLANGPADDPHTLRVRQQFSAIAPFLLNALAHTANPDAILLRLGQIFGKLPAISTLYALLENNPALSHFLVTLVANSEYLCSILIRDPGLLDILSSFEEMDRITTRQQLREELGFLKKAADEHAALYRLRDGEMLRVAVRELSRNTSTAQVGDELSQLAEVVLEDALIQARDQVNERYGAEAVPFAILGLGKLGGWEMGYGSDLDLLFVYEGGHELACRMSCVEYFAAIASRVMRSLKEPTRYGILYDIDARLRPDGNKGVLAISHEHLEEYYTRQAQPWERFALMKVRAVAGDPLFRRRVEQIAKEAAFSLPLNTDSLDHTESLRQRNIKGSSPLNLKKQAGGISEIEMTCRLWQLQHVQARPELKRGDVFGALDILDAHELVDPAESALLREAYRNLRRVLNRIRMMDGGQGSELPATPEARAELAARLGLQEDLESYCLRWREQVHTIYQRTFEAALAAAETAG